MCHTNRLTQWSSLRTQDLTVAGLILGRGKCCAYVAFLAFATLHIRSVAYSPQRCTLH
jgi:hypothetical protein